jgi:chlorite dismutase
MSETTYVLYPVFRATPELRASLRDPELVVGGARELQELLEGRTDRVHLRGAYSTVGFRADADLMLWLVAPSPDDLQRLLVEIRRTRIGSGLELRWSFMGVVKPAEFTADHAPAFVKQTPPKRIACVYPFVRTPEWYLLPREERAAMLAEHGVIGREFPEVLANTTSGFGLGDWEWILCFEADEAHVLVDCIRRLRDAQARRYTKEEVPFVTGIRKPLPSVIEDLA